MADTTLLLRYGSLGDVVLLGSITAALSGRVVVVTSPAWTQVANALRGVDHVIPWVGTARALAQQLPSGRVIDVQGSLRSRALCLALGRPVSRIRKRSIRRRLWLWWGGAWVRPKVTTLYGEAAGVIPRPAPWIDPGTGARDALALIPGASRATKQWAMARYIQVGQWFDGPVVILGGPGEQPLCVALGRALPGARVVCEPGFTRTLAALSRVRVAVGGDTGLVHLAAACGAQVVTLFGPSHPHDGFAVHGGPLVERQLACRPCSLHGRVRCPKGHHRCMDLPVGWVQQAVTQAMTGVTP